MTTQAREETAAAIDLDLVPDDPQRRNWTSLGDYELTLHRKYLIRDSESEHAAEYLKRVELEITLRDELWKLEQDPEFETPEEFDSVMERATYADQLRVLEAIEREKARRAVEGNADEIVIGTGALSGEMKDGALDVIDADETMSDELANCELSQSAIEQLSLFDYAQLDEKTAIVVKGHADEIKARVKTIYENTVEIGTRLRDVKSRLQRGQFDDWLEKETIFSRDTADRLIAVAVYAKKSPQFAENLNRFNKSAAYLLVAPSTPESARIEAIARAAAGERFNSAKVEQIAEAHKPEPGLLVNQRDNIPAQDSGQNITENIISPRMQEPPELMQLSSSAMQSSPENIPKSIPPPGDLSTADTEAESVKQAEAEVVATGRRADDLLSLLKSHPDGMLEQDLFRMGFSETTIDGLRLEGEIEKDIGKWFIATKPTSAKPAAQPAVEKRPALEELLNGRQLAVTFTYLPALPSRVMVGVCVGDDRTKINVNSLESSKIRFSEPVLDLIAEQLKATEKQAAVRKVAAKKPAATKRGTAKKTAPVKKVAAAKSASKKPAPAKKSTAKKAAKKN